VAVTVALSVLFVLVAGGIVAAVCGYRAGLVGSSNSPISGVGIISALGIALILAALFGSGAAPKPLVAFALFVTAIVFGIAPIANDNLQDLKTGQLVGATPWRQQAALVLGVIFGAIVIPPVLDLLNVTFGFQGAPGAGKDALAAPQAALISAIAQGVLGGTLDWSLIGIGALIGAAAIVIDEVLRRTKRGALPPLAVGMGMYLPLSVTALIILGAVLGHFYNRWASRQAGPAPMASANIGTFRQGPGFAERMGVLTATGLIVGDSLFNVAYAGIVAATNDPDVLGVAAAGAWQTPLGLAVFAGFVLLAYLRMRRAARPL
jgi:putative OPT family oligopeptide transporter